MGLADLLREGWLIGLDWLGGRRLGLRRLVTACALGGVLLALFGGAQVARAATPQWTATVAARTCDAGRDSITLALDNASTQPVQFSLWQNTGRPGAQTTSQNASSRVWEQPVDAGQSVERQASVAPGDDPGQTSTVNYTLFVNAVEGGGRPGAQLARLSGSENACAGRQSQGQAAGAQWVAQQGALGMVQLFAGATDAMLQASSSLLGVDSPATSGRNGRVGATAILAGTIPGGPDAGDTRYGMVRGLGLIIMVVLITLVIIASVARRQPGEPIVSIFIWAPLALIAGGVVFFFADALIGSVDQITYWMISPDWSQVGAYLAALQKVYDPNQLDAADGWQLGVVFIGALLTLVASLAIFVMLLLRSIAIDLLVLFIPLAFAGLVAPWTRGWTAKAVEAMIGLVFSKFVILVLLGTGIVAFGMAGGALAQPELAAAGAGGQGQVNSLTGIVASFVLLLAAAVGPAVVGRLIPVARVHLAGAIAPGGYAEVAGGGSHQTSAAVYQHLAGTGGAFAGGAAQAVGRGLGRGVAGAASGVKRGLEEAAGARRERGGKETGRQSPQRDPAESRAMARFRRIEREQRGRRGATPGPEERNQTQVRAFLDGRCAPGDQHDLHER